MKSHKIEQSLAGARHAEEESKKTRSQLDKLLIEAKKRVNDFADVEIRKAHKGMEGLRSKFDRELENHRSTWEGRFGDLQQQRERFLEILDTTKRYYKESRFDEYSRQEQLEANRYRRIGMALMVLVAIVVVMLTSFSIYGTYDASPGSIADRYLLVFSLMIPAIYATRESNRHRGNSDRYSQMACELTAFEVVLQDEDMPSSMKHEIKAEIIKRYFGAMTVFASKDMIDVLGVRPFSNSKKGKEGRKDKGEKISVKESEET